MWFKQNKNKGAIINKIKMLKMFNCLGLYILALEYFSCFLLIGSEKIKFMKHL